MKSRPILFNNQMVRAILAGTKTQTRRVVKPQPDMGKAIANLADCSVVTGIDMAGAIPGVSHMGLLGMTTCTANGYQPWGYTEPNIRCPFGQPGDRLWVRETFTEFVGHHATDGARYAYKADTCRNSDEFRQDYIKAGFPYQWKPSIHMPIQASRITLEITAVRVERLNEISEEGAKAEGAENGVKVNGLTPLQSYRLAELSLNGLSRHRMGYSWLWESIYGHGSWDANPWVWVVEFKRVMP